jgi:hypothetical protein
MFLHAHKSSQCPLWVIRVELASAVSPLIPTFRTSWAHGTFIPREGKLVVTRTRDGGKSFEVLSKGLPQSHAYDVVYRHALALDATGERLAFGSTTGGLWVSEDQGDS